MSETIEAPNFCGQGYCPAHEQAPYHGVAITLGYRYTHSTYVTYPDGARRTWHTYKQGEHCVSFTGSTLEPWSTSVSTGSGRHWEGKGASALARHLRNKQRRYKELT